MSYNNEFASVYDLFTENVDYESRAAYIISKLKKNGIKDGILLDSACGTGSFLSYFKQAGYDVIGVDISPDMLSVAREKINYDKDILLLCQDMKELDLYGTIDAAVCSLDSINHLLTKEDVLAAFQSISLFMRKNGVFVFDVNTVYKHRHVLSDNCFIYENENVFLTWQNSLCDDENRIDIMLDIFFEDEDGRYIRASEDFTERAYSVDDLCNLLDKADFDLISINGDMTELMPDSKEERIYFTAIKR